MLDKVSLLNATNLIERQFSCNNYNGINLSLRPYSVKLGTNNILISAPHSVNHKREDRLKKADIYTGSIASIVQLCTNSFCILSNRLSEEDPNYIIGGQYKSTIRDICNTFKIDLILDLHGAGINRAFDIDLGTINGDSIDDNSTNLIKNIFIKNGVSNVKTNDVFNASHPGTITSFARNSLNIKAIQIEINRAFRDPKSNFEAYESLIKSIIEIVNNFKKE